MIHRLNQLGFRKFGTIFAEGQNNSDPTDITGDRTLLQLSRNQAPVFRSTECCWVCPGEGMTVLAVSLNDEAVHHYHLDKTVCIHPGVLFSLFPLGESSTAELVAAALPQPLEYRKADEDLRTTPQLKVESIYSLFFQEKEQGFFFPGEAHPMLELTYVDRGTVHSVADGTELMLEQGDMVLYSPNQWHMQYADIGVAPRFVTISFDASGRIPKGLYNQKLRASQKVLSLLNQMLREQEQGDDYSGDVILSLLSQLLILLHRSQSAAPERTKTSHCVQNENEIIRRTQQYISNHVRQKLSVSLVAQHVDVSPSYLTALFHKHLQLAPGEYIRRIKLQESKQMIRENSMNFTQIAATLQYSTVHHFSRQFKDKFGITPSEYAKSVR